MKPLTETQVKSIIIVALSSFFGSKKMQKKNKFCSVFSFFSPGFLSCFSHLLKQIRTQKEEEEEEEDEEEGEESMALLYCFLVFSFCSF